MAAEIIDGKKISAEIKEEVKAEVALAEAEKTFDELLRKGKVAPAEKAFLIPLLVSDTEIELADGKKVTSRKALIEYLESQSPKFFLSEEGTSNKPDKKVKKEKRPEDVEKLMDKMNLSEEDRGEVFE